MNFLKKLCLFILFCIAFKVNSQVVTVFDTIHADVGGQDSYVRSNAPTSNYGNNGNFLVLRVDGTTPGIYRAFIEFDLNHIPQNAIIIDAKLKINAYTGFTGHVFDYYLERVVDDWNKSTINWNNQVGAYTSDRITVSHPDSKTIGVHEINVTNHVQKMVNYPYNNHGWRIILHNESLTGAHYGTYFRSSNYSTVSQRPRLEIKYILPIEISGEVSHCTNGNSDGTIDIDIEKGSTVYNEYWFFKVGATNLDTLENETSFSSSLLFENLDPGLYLFKVNDILAITQHKFFILGEEGDTTTVTFPFYLGEEFIEDAELIKNKSTTVTTDHDNINYGLRNWHNANTRPPGPGIMYESLGLVNYNMDYSPDLEFTEATFINNPYAQYYRASNSSNERNFAVIKDPWQEMVVTWNCRPDVDTAVGVILPMTTSTGWVTQYDTVSFLDHISYWQENTNYGIMILLTEYDQPNTTYSQFKSSSQTSGITYTLKYTVKPKLTPEFFDEKAEGNINVIAPPGDLPYTYLLSYEPIPDLNTIWQSIKDSIPVVNQSPIFDSLYFFQGKENTYNYTFEGLKAERYYVAVFDNNGDEIFQSSTVLSPEVLLFDYEDIIHVNDSIFLDTNAVGGGNCNFFGELEKENSGGIEFILADLDDFTFGFNYSNDSLITDETDLEFGFKITSGSTLNVYLLGTYVDDYSVSQGDTIRLMKNNNFFQLYKNGAVLHEDSISTALTGHLKIDMLIPNGKTAVLTGVFHLIDFIKPKPIFLDIIHAECPDGLGQVTLSVPSSYYSKSVTTISIVNQITEESVPGPIDDDDILNLGVGIYTISYTYTYYYPIGHPLYPSVSYPGGTQEFIIGYPVEWIYNNPTDNITESGLNNIRPTNFTTEANAKSYNSSPPSEDWWYNFETYEFKKAYLAPPVNYEIRIEMKYASESLPELYIWNPADPILIKYVYFNGEFFEVTNDKSFTIIQDDGEVVIKNNSNVILPLTGTYTNTNTGALNILANEEGRGVLANNLVSFCSNYPIPLQYVQLHRKLLGGYYLVPLDDVLRVKYIEEYMDSDGDLNFTVYDKAGAEQTITNPTVIFGDNRIDFDVSSLTQGYYILEIKNDKNEKFYLRFRVQ